MNGLDVAILVVFFGSTIIGLVRGFTKELLSLFSWGGAISLTYVLLPIGRGFVSPYIANPMMADLVAGICIFVVLLILLSIIASIIAGHIHESSFRGVDRSLGFAFGILRGVAVICAAELGFSVFFPRQLQPPVVQSARFIPMVRKGGNTLLQFLPTSVRQMIIEQAIRVEAQLKNNLSQGIKQMPQNMVPGGSANPMDGISAGMGTVLNRSGTPMPGGNVPQGVPQGPQGYSGQAQPYGYPATGQPQPANAPMPPGNQGETQMMQPQMAQPQTMQPQPGMMAPTQPAQSVQYGAYPTQQPVMTPAPNLQSNGSQMNASNMATTPQGIVQSMKPQDTQSTVDQLSRLTPQATPKEESGYTQGQLDDMNRLFQAADGEE